MPTLKIATFNINGIRSRVAALGQWLEREAPDIVCLQELKTVDEGFPAREIRDAGYGAVWHGQKSWNGVAILARGAEPVEVRRGLPGDPDNMRRPGWCSGNRPRGASVLARRPPRLPRPPLPPAFRG